VLDHIAESPCVLVVDDAQELRSFLQVILEEQGYTVRLAADGLDALASVDQHRPDLVLLDVEMPRMDGFETCRRLKANEATEDIPVIFLTSEDDTQRVAGGFDLGAVDYVTKPFSDVELLARVRTHVRLTQLVRRLDRAAANLSKYLPAKLCEAIFSGDAAVRIESQQKPLTICFADIAGFTPLVEAQHPRELTQWLNNYFNEMAIIINRFGGTLDKYIGDAIMVFFGAPDSEGESEDAVRCVQMARAMLSRSRELGIPVRVGISSGECTVGNFGSDLQMGFTIVGKEANVAARLQTASAPGRILISRSTFDLIHESERCRPNAEICVKGLQRSLMTYWVNN
jgi:class 3 adenylate cyclase